jgi:hypothetical protein
MEDIMFQRFLAALPLIAALAAPQFAAAAASDRPSAPAPDDVLLSAPDLEEIATLYKRLIDAENCHDIEAVRQFVWVSPNALFVAKTATAAEGNWAGFWGTEVVLQHLNELYKAGPFRIDPDNSKEKVVALSHDVAETYVPVNITVAYAGQVPVPKPFLMILEWVRTQDGWKMATDIALPIPPPPSGQTK